MICFGSVDQVSIEGNFLPKDFSAPSPHQPWMTLPLPLLWLLPSHVCPREDTPSRHGLAVRSVRQLEVISSWFCQRHHSCGLVHGMCVLPLRWYRLLVPLAPTPKMVPHTEFHGTPFLLRTLSSTLRVISLGVLFSFALHWAACGFFVSTPPRGVMHSLAVGAFLTSYVLSLVNSIYSSI